MAAIDPSTLEWRELFAASVQDKFNANEKLLVEIRDLVKAQNTQVRANELAIAAKPDEKRVRANEIAIAGLKTWVAVVGGLGGIGGLLAVILAWAMR